MCFEFKSDYQKSFAWAVYLHGHETNLGFSGFKIPPKTDFGPSREPRGMLPWKILKTEPLRLAKDAFPAYSYGDEVS